MDNREVPLTAAQKVAFYEGYLQGYMTAVNESTSRRDFLGRQMYD